MVSTELVLGVGLACFLAGFVGVLLILLKIRLSERNLRWGIGFGAGILIGLSFLEILPEAMELAPHGAMAFVVIGFMGFFIIERFTQIHRFEHMGEKGGFHFSKASFVALCLHAFLDGVVIGMGLHLGETFGMIVFAAILFHKLPLAASVASIFLGKEDRKSAIIQMLIFAGATPVGLAAAYAGLGEVPVRYIGFIMALSAGMFLYLGATDMLPEISHGGHGGHDADGHQHRPSAWLSWESTLWVFVGILASLLPRLFGIEGHDHHH